MVRIDHSNIHPPYELLNASHKLHSINGSCNETLCPTDLNPEKEFWALLLIPLPLVAVVGNILVILSIYKEKSLQTVTNYFIVSLACADLLVAAVCMPFAVYVLVNVDWELSETLCDFYIAVDVTCSTASILNLVAISVDRYIAVTRPISYSKHRNNWRGTVGIAVVWLVSAAIGSPIVLGLNTSPERIPQLCVFYNSDFIIYSSLLSFYFPCIVMVFLYYQIFKAIRERAKKNKRRSAGSTPSPVVRSSLKATPTQHHTLQVVTVERDGATTTNSGSLQDDDLDDEDDVPNGDDYDHPHHRALVRLTTITKEAPPTKEETPKVDKKNGILVTTKNEKTEVVVERKKRSRFNLGKRHKSSSKKREKASAKRERKATKTLAIVLGMFLMCWVPFFTCNVLDAICIKLENDTWRPGMTVFLFTTWLGYINSCVNPVIYTIFNMEFRKAFKKLLQGMCLCNNAAPK